MRNLVSDAKHAYESNEVIIGNVPREIDALQALRPRAAAERLNEEMSTSSPPSEEQRRAGTKNELWTVYELARERYTKYHARQWNR